MESHDRVDAVQVSVFRVGTETRGGAGKGTPGKARPRVRQQEEVSAVVCSRGQKEGETGPSKDHLPLLLQKAVPLLCLHDEQQVNRAQRIPEHRELSENADSNGVEMLLHRRNRTTRNRRRVGVPPNPTQNYFQVRGAPSHDFGHQRRLHHC